MLGQLGARRFTEVVGWKSGSLPHGHSMAAFTKFRVVKGVQKKGDVPSLLRALCPLGSVGVQVSQEPGNVLTGFPEFLLNLCSHYQLFSPWKWLRLWRPFGDIFWSWTFACISHDPVILSLSVYINNWNAYICSPKGMYNQVHRGTIRSHLKVETTNGH